MRLEINDKPVELKFSFEFIERMDKRFATAKEASDMGVGLSVGLGLLERTYSPTTRVDVIYSATDGVSKDNIKKFVENYANENESLEPLYGEIISEIKKAPMLTATLKKMDKLMSEYMKNQA